MVMSATSLSDVSEMAMVPDNEWRIPALIGSDDCARRSEGMPESVKQAVMVTSFESLRLFMGVFLTYRMPDGFLATDFKQSACHSGPMNQRNATKKRLISFSSANSCSAHRNLCSYHLNGLLVSAQFELSRIHRLSGDLYHFAQSERYVSRDRGGGWSAESLRLETHHQQPVEFI